MKRDKLKTIDTIKVDNLTDQKGDPIGGIIIIWTPEGKYLQSFGSLIAVIPEDTFLNRPIINKSKWSSAHRIDIKALCTFFDIGAVEIEKRIDNGEILLGNV